MQEPDRALLERPSFIRVLHVIDKLSMDGVNPSSVARLLVDWNRWAPSSGFEMVVVNLRYDRGCDFVEENGVRLEWFRSGAFRLPRDVRKVRELAEKHRAQILHGHGYYASYLVRLAAPGCGCRAVIHEHAVLKKKPWFWIGDWLLRNRTDCGVAVSHGVRDFMANARCVPEEKIAVIYDGIDLGRFSVNVPPPSLRRKFGLPEEAWIAGVAARLREEKGVHFFVQAAHRLHQELPQMHFVVAGDGPQREDLLAQARALGLDSGTLQFLGHVDEIPSLLTALDAVVVPSIREGFGLSVVEAMACGKPVVATAVGGIPEAVGSPENAILVPPADPEALAKGIRRLYEDPQLAAELGEKGRRNAQRFSIQQSAAQLGELYRNLLSR
ncbi:MAG: glycosyltransferase family 4 protein [candidate division KSB1 bacterium]|nr:glycosyltransferase family 4 protein [candidate division KSB1 bacterium]